MSYSASRRAVNATFQCSRRCASTSAASPDVRSQLLQAALKHIPEHGFSVRTLQKAASSLPAFQNLAATPLGIEQLFPSLPPRSTPSLLAASSSLFKGKAPEAPIETERLGPVRALFEAWTEDRREALQSLAKDIKKGHEGVRQALKMRLEDNMPVLPFLPEALRAVAVKDPTRFSLPSLSSYTQHARAIAYDIKTITKAETSLTRLATVYSLAERYQTSQTKPSMQQTMQTVDRLLKSTGEVDSTIRDSLEFGSYVMTSWKNIFKSRGL